jgi:hypothetical protein
MATRLGGVQPHFEKGNWYMRSPSIHATSSAGAMTQPLAQVKLHAYSQHAITLFCAQLYSAHVCTHKHMRMRMWM